MATVENQPTEERRHIPDRRINSATKTVNRQMTTIDWVALVALMVGGVNWGLIGLFNFDLVSAIFGTALTRILYVLVGVAAIYTIYSSIKITTSRDKKA